MAASGSPAGQLTPPKAAELSDFTPTKAGSRSVMEPKLTSASMVAPFSMLASVRSTVRLPKDMSILAPLKGSSPVTFLVSVVKADSTRT